MSLEILGFLSGLAGGALAMALMLRQERWRTIRAVYGSRRPHRVAGNALIWPSR